MAKKMGGSVSGKLAAIASVVAAAVLAACGGGGGDGGGADAGQGTLQMSLTDAPACYKSVKVTVEKVRVQKSSTAAESDSGWQEIVPPGGPVTVDLLDLDNGKIAELGAATVDAGTYSQVRLVLAENTTARTANSVTLLDGTVVPLTTPSAQQSGLKIKADFTVARDTTTPMLLDFDACKSIVVAGNSGQYILKPVVRFTTKAAGSVQGYVSTTMSLTATSVSAQQGGSIVRSTRPDAAGKFTLAYLPAGTYTVVITSDNRATGVVDSVPVGTSTTVLSGTATAIVLPTSTMGTVTGTVTAGTTPVTDAAVTALQSIGSQLLEIASANVDFTTAAYKMALPAAQPVRATYAGAPLGASAFTATGTAGAYTLKADSSTKGTVTTTTAITGGTTTTTNISY
jgi:hypothetical protein